MAYHFAMQLRSQPPSIILAKHFSTPFDNAVATARTCYSSRVITDDDVRKNLPLRDRIASSTYKAGHHTTLQHAHFEFIFDNVSRQALWSFFHAHPFYNSEQVSQRYVEVKPGRVLLPELGSAELNARYDAATERQMACYHRLGELLLPTVERLYFGIFPARKRTVIDKRWTGSIQKRCQEVARYVLPIGTHAHLYHTVSGLTLHRYHRMSQMEDCPSEQRLIVDAMVAAVAAVDPDFVALMEEALALEQTHEPALVNAARPGPALDVEAARAFRNEFDASLDGLTSKLVSMTEQPEAIIGGGVREVLGLPMSRLSDEEAVALLLDPAKNPLLGEALNLGSLAKGMRALELVQVTFRRKISHSADSQAQRHRMTPGVRPVLWMHMVPGEADYVLPVLLEEPDAEDAKRVFVDEMNAAFADVQFLHDRGVSPQVWQYLLPNAVPVRYTETGSLLDQHHKWTTRLCYNAQEEIWRATKDEVDQLAKRAPLLAAWQLAPCGQRKRANAQPYCPEGERFCGQPVWQKQRSDYLRIL